MSTEEQFIYTENMICEHYRINEIEFGLKFHPFEKAQYMLFYWLKRKFNIPAHQIAEHYKISYAQVYSGIKSIARPMKKEPDWRDWDKELKEGRV